MRSPRNPVRFKLIGPQGWLEQVHLEKAYPLQSLRAPEAFREAKRVQTQIGSHDGPTPQAQEVRQLSCAAPHFQDSGVVGDLVAKQAGVDAFP